MSMTTTAWILLLSVLLSRGAFADTHYVSLSGGHTHPFTNWPAAATNIQAAVDAASSGDTVQVAYGIYDKGGRAATGGAVKNRVLVDKQLALVGTPSPEMAKPAILGKVLPNEGVRCVWLADGASISGFQIMYGVADKFVRNDDMFEGRDAMSMTTTAWILLLSVLLSRGAFADTHYVSLSGSHTHPFTNWPAAATNIQAAVDAASSGDTVRVAYGLYDKGGRPASGSMVMNRVLVDKPVALVGTPSPGMAKPVIRGKVLTNEDVRCVWLGDGASVSGFQIMYGVADKFVRNDDMFGGGVFCEGARATVADCDLSYNAADRGGGVYGGMTSNSVVSQNNAGAGGGIFAGKVTNCRIEFNEANGGGGLCESEVWNTSVVSNSAYSGGGGFGGSFHNCEFVGNVGDLGGGGVMDSSLFNCTLMGNHSATGGGAAAFSTLRDCRVERNESAMGGGVFYSTLYDCTLVSNSATYSDIFPAWYYGGGGAWSGVLFRCTLVGNRALASAGGGANFSTMYDCRLERNEADEGGGAGWSTLQRCTVKDNSARVGGGVSGSELANCLVSGNRATYAAGATGGVLRACTVVSNTATGYAGGTWDCTQENSIVYFNVAPTDANWRAGVFNNSCALPLPPGVGNLAVDPGFVNAQRGDYRLRYGSPCIDAGMALATVTNDLLGVRRPLDGDWDGLARQDMGAYEYDAGRVDSDGDGMRDGWERRYGLKPLDADGTVDADKDGVVNRDEFAADTDPRDADSFFKLLSVTGFPVRVAFEPSSTGRWYTLQWRKGLTETAWSNVAGQVEVSGAGNLQALQDASVSPQRFYRVGVRVK